MLPYVIKLHRHYLTDVKTVNNTLEIVSCHWSRNKSKAIKFDNLDQAEAFSVILGSRPIRMTPFIVS